MIGSLCTGVGALDLAVSEVFGMPVAWQSEVDPHAASVLSERFPECAQMGDLTTADFGSVEPVEVMCFGFSCQDLSQAGKGAGIKEGTRSGIFFNCWDAVRVVRPRYVIMENVPAILTRRPGIDVVADCMARDGYEFQWVCVRASDVGACHRRKRWFCIATDPTQPERRGPQQQTVGTPEGPTTELGERDREFDWREYGPAIRRHETVLGRPAPHPVDDEGRLSSRFTEWMMCLPDGWCSSLETTVAVLSRHQPPGSAAETRTVKATRNGG